MITWVVTRRADQTEVRVSEILCVGDGDNTIASEARSTEVRMIEDIEELRTELHAVTVGELHILEEGQVDAVEARPNGSCWRVTESSGTLKRNTSCGDQSAVRSGCQRSYPEFTSRM